MKAGGLMIPGMEKVKSSHIQPQTELAYDKKGKGETVKAPEAPPR